MTIEAHIQVLVIKYYEAYRMITVFWQYPILSEQNMLNWLTKLHSQIDQFRCLAIGTINLGFAQVLIAESFHISQLCFKTIFSAIASQ
jgi:hypothetical protein